MARTYPDAGLKETFVFFKHEDEGKGPKLARSFSSWQGMKRALGAPNL